MTKDDIQLFYEYDRWNNRVLQAVSTLSDERFPRNLDGSFVGLIRLTCIKFTHTIGTELN